MAPPQFRYPLQPIPAKELLSRRNIATQKKKPRSIVGKATGLTKPQRSVKGRSSHGQQHCNSRELNFGRWTKSERIAFLRGLRRYGRGHWKQIGQHIPTRTTLQVKTHSQLLMKQWDAGRNIFVDYDLDVAEGEDHTTPADAPPELNEPVTFRPRGMVDIYGYAPFRHNPDMMPAPSVMTSPPSETSIPGSLNGPMLVRPRALARGQGYIPPSINATAPTLNPAAAAGRDEPALFESSAMVGVGRYFPYEMNASVPAAESALTTTETSAAEHLWALKSMRPKGHVSTRIDATVPTFSPVMIRSSMTAASRNGPVILRPGANGHDYFPSEMNADIPMPDPALTTPPPIEATATEHLKKLRLVRPKGHASTRTNATVPAFNPVVVRPSMAAASRNGPAILRTGAIADDHVLPGINVSVPMPDPALTTPPPTETSATARLNGPQLVRSRAMARVREHIPSRINTTVPTFSSVAVAQRELVMLGPREMADGYDILLSDLPTFGSAAAAQHEPVMFGPREMVDGYDIRLSDLSISVPTFSSVAAAQREPVMFGPREMVDGYDILLSDLNISVPTYQPRIIRPIPRSNGELVAADSLIDLSQGPPMTTETNHTEYSG